MGKGSGSNKEAIALQRETMAESSRANKEMLALLSAQVENAKNLKLPKAAPPMPLPDSSGADAIAQSQEFRRNLMHRSGLNATKIAQPAMRSALGTPMFGMAA